MTPYTGAKPIPSPFFETKGVCSECSRPRGAGSHVKCSKARQARFAAENGARNV